MRWGSLFALAHVCHLSPAQVDDLSFIEFLMLSATADEWLKKGLGNG